MIADAEHRRNLVTIALVVLLVALMAMIFAIVMIWTRASADALRQLTTNRAICVDVDEWRQRQTPGGARR